MEQMDRISSGINLMNSMASEIWIYIENAILTAPLKGEQKVFFFVFQMSLVEKSKNNCIFRFVGLIVKFWNLDTQSLKLKPK